MSEMSEQEAQMAVRAIQISMKQIYLVLKKKKWLPVFVIALDKEKGFQLIGPQGQLGALLEKLNFEEKFKVEMVRGMFSEEIDE